MEYFGTPHLSPEIITSRVTWSLLATPGLLARKEMIFLDQYEVSKKCFISHYFLDHNTQRLLIKLKKSCHHHNAPSMHTSLIGMTCNAQ